MGRASESSKSMTLEEMCATINSNTNNKIDDLSGKIDSVAVRVGNLELKVNYPQDQAQQKAEEQSKTPAPVVQSVPPPPQAGAGQEQVSIDQSPATGGATGSNNMATDSVWMDDDDDIQVEDGEDEWRKVVRGVSKTTRKLLPKLGTDEEALRLGGYQPSKQEVHRYNKRRTEVLQNVDKVVRGFDELEKDQMPSRSAWDGHMPRKRREAIDKLYSQIEGLRNPATRKVDRWRKETIDNPSYNIYVQPGLYQQLQEELSKPPPPNVKTSHHKMRHGLVNLMKRELLIGPFLQSDWSREDEKAGGMKNRPSYLLQMLCDHLTWYMDFTEEQLSQLKIVAIKPVEDSLASLYPGQLRVTFLTKQMADTVLMCHAQTRGNYSKKASKVKVMVADEFMTRYQQLAAAATMKRNIFNSESKAARMFTFITYSAGSLEIAQYKTSNRKAEWQIMNTPRSVHASMWEDQFEYKRGIKLEPYQKRIIEKREAKKVDFGSRIMGKWQMPTIKPAP